MNPFNLFAWSIVSELKEGHLEDGCLKRFISYPLHISKLS